MTGIKIDGTQNKVVLDDDADTYFEAATDDTIKVYVAGAQDFTITANTLTAESGSTIAAQALTATSITATGDISLDGGSFVFNESSADKDFRVESNGNTHQFFVDAGNDRIYVGGGTGSSIGSNKFQVQNGGATISSFANDSGSNQLHFIKSRNTSVGSQTIVNDGDSVGGIFWKADDGNATDYNNNVAGIEGVIDGTPGTDDTPGRLVFYTTSDGARTNTERARITSTGYLLVGKTAVGTAEGNSFHPEGQGQFIRDQGVPLVVQRNGDDGDVVKIQQAGSLEGTISVSGSTVSYNAFTGGHWSRLADNSKPTILRGTIMDSIDEMCDWYQAVADVAESTDDEGNVTPAHTVKEQIALGDKSVGDAITFTSDGTEYTGTIVKEDDVKHTKSKVSDTADSKKVYGVFSNWDDTDDGLDGDVNDMNIAQVGTYIIRVNKDVTVEAGDLLVSNGDGTAKVQDDDIIRSKTVAKVNSNIKVETYSDGSYTVPCTLHC